MRRPLNAFLIITVLFLIDCRRKEYKASVQLNNICDSCCLKKLALFADKLHIRQFENFSNSFDEKHFSLGNCKLKKYRGNASLKSSLVLIWLKIDQVYLKNHWNYAYIQDIGGNSKAASQIVFEFYFLTTKNDKPWIEYMEASWVNSVVQSDSSLLKNKQIEKLFNQNRLLKLHNKLSKIHKK